MFLNCVYIHIIINHSTNLLLLLTLLMLLTKYVFVIYHRSDYESAVWSCTVWRLSIHIFLDILMWIVIQIVVYLSTCLVSSKLSVDSNVALHWNKDCADDWCGVSSLVCAQESKDNVEIALKAFVDRIYKARSEGQIGVLCDVLECLVETNTIPAK